MANFSWLAYGISHGYITDFAGVGTDTPHYANDIGTPFHTPVTALFDGTVVSQRTGLAWGSEIFIQPDNQALPQYYYYHNDELKTSVGEHVSAGDIIALSGGQNSGGSNPTTPEFSTGPHTHVGFFTKWTTTPDSRTIPYGPDITPYIKALARGQSTAGLTVDTTGNPPANSGIPGGLAQLGETIVASLGINQTIITALAHVSSEPFAIIGGVVVALAIALLLAVWLIMNGGF